MVIHCLYTHDGLFTLHFPTRTRIINTSSPAFRQHSQRIQKKLLFCVQPFPLPCPSLSFQNSQHMETIVGSKFFCTSVSSRWKKGGRACVCLCWVWLITPTLCSISWIVHIPSLPSKKESSHSLWQVSKQLYSCQNNHKPLLSFLPHSPRGRVFPDKEHLHSKNGNGEG